MTVSQELVWLINQIRNTASPRERLRLLALGWRTLKGLSTADRLAVARELGFDGAERLVEQLARRGGASPSLLLQGLESLESADPDQVSGLVRDLTDSQHRADTAGRLVSAAAEWLAEEAATAATADTGEMCEEAPSEFEEPAVDVKPPPPPPLPPPEPVEVRQPTDNASEAAPRVEEPEPEREDQTLGEERASDIEDVGAPEPPPVDEETDDIPRLVVEVPPRPQNEEPVASPATPIETVAAELARITSLTSRFRALQRVVHELDGVGARDLIAVVETFPPGWARRRAIETIVRTGVPRELGEALDLISTLERPSQRMWALSTLATSRDLDDDECEELLAAAGSPMIERRLRLRLTP